LTSAVTATRVESEAGTLDLSPATALFVPALRGRDREILRAYWERFVGDGAYGLTHEVESWEPGDFVPWWWLPTVEALTAMGTTAGFRVEAGEAFWNDNFYTLLLAAR